MSIYTEIRNCLYNNQPLMDAVYDPVKAAAMGRTKRNDLPFFNIAVPPGFIYQMGNDSARTTRGNKMVAIDYCLLDMEARRTAAPPLTIMPEAIADIRLRCVVHRDIEVYRSVKEHYPANVGVDKDAGPWNASQRATVLSPSVSWDTCLSHLELYGDVNEATWTYFPKPGQSWNTITDEYDIVQWDRVDIYSVVSLDPADNYGSWADVQDDDSYEQLDKISELVILAILEKDFGGIETTLLASAEDGDERDYEGQTRETGIDVGMYWRELIFTFQYDPSAM